ncbi:MAG: hypothetical protein LBT97_12405 [Planctomycetota bacterium]|nr:hypothetical protein [Planctomycetota bacterium]
MEVQAQELRDLRAEIARLNEYVDTVKSLYRSRIVWARILADVKAIVNFDPAMSEYNADMRYLWLTNLAGSSSSLKLQGFATAANSILAMQMPERLLQGFQSYAPREMPEKDEEDRLDQELQQVIAENEALRRNNPDLPVQSSREIALRERLAEIREIASGGLALQPFSSFIVPGSLRLEQANWTSAPMTPRGRANEETPEQFPNQAWSFSIVMNLLQ